MGDPQESANERRHEHVEAVEEILDSIDPSLEEHAYPVNSEDLSAQYAESVEGLPNETESLGSVFDRLEDDEYDSPMEVKEAVIREVSGASPEPTTAGANREPEPGSQGAPQEVLDDLESVDADGDAREAAERGVPADAEAKAEDVAESTREGTPTDVEEEAADVGTPADTASGPETDAAEPGDEMTPGTTEADEFAPQDTVEDRDREGDRRASVERSSDRGDPWETAEEEPGDPAEPTAEPAEEELDPEERGAEVPDARDEVDASDPSERARYGGDDEEPLEGSSGEERTDSPVPDARDEDREVTREGNVPDDEDGGD